MPLAPRPLRAEVGHFSTAAMLKSVPFVRSLLATFAALAMPKPGKSRFGGRQERGSSRSAIAAALAEALSA